MTEPGPTGKFPEGKLNDVDDEGELAIGITTSKGVVIVNIGLPPSEARQFAALILEHAKAAEAQGTGH